MTCDNNDNNKSSDNNNNKEKLSKYKDLEVEITKMWGLKTLTLPLSLGHLHFGLVKKGIEKHIDKIPTKINITELQKIAFLRSSHIL